MKFGDVFTWVLLLVTCVGLMWLALEYRTSETECRVLVRSIGGEEKFFEFSSSNFSLVEEDMVEFRLRMNMEWNNS